MNYRSYFTNFGSKVYNFQLILKIDNRSPTTYKNLIVSQLLKNALVIPILKIDF